MTTILRQLPVWTGTESSDRKSWTRDKKLICWNFSYEKISPNFRRSYLYGPNTRCVLTLSKGLRKFAAERQLDRKTARPKPDVAWFAAIKPHLELIRNYVKIVNAEISMWGVILALAVIKLVWNYCWCNSEIMCNKLKFKTWKSISHARLQQFQKKNDRPSPSYQSHIMLFSSLYLFLQNKIPTVFLANNYG